MCMDNHIKHYNTWGVAWEQEVQGTIDDTYIPSDA